jgi:hypothetical protein
MERHYVRTQSKHHSEDPKKKDTQSTTAQSKTSEMPKAPRAPKEPTQPLSSRPKLTPKTRRRNFNPRESIDILDWKEDILFICQGLDSVSWWLSQYSAEEHAEHIISQFEVSLKKLDKVFTDIIAHPNSTDVACCFYTRFDMMHEVISEYLEKVKNIKKKDPADISFFSEGSRVY